MVDKTPFRIDKAPRFRRRIRAQPNGLAAPQATAAKTQIPCKLAPLHNLHRQTKPWICSCREVIRQFSGDETAGTATKPTPPVSYYRLIARLNEPIPRDDIGAHGVEQTPARGRDPTRRPGRGAHQPGGLRRDRTRTRGLTPRRKANHSRGRLGRPVPRTVSYGIPAPRLADRRPDARAPRGGSPMKQTRSASTHTTSRSGPSPPPSTPTRGPLHDHAAPQVQVARDPARLGAEHGFASPVGVGDNEDSCFGDPAGHRVRPTAGAITTSTRA